MSKAVLFWLGLIGLCFLNMRLSWAALPNGVTYSIQPIVGFELEKKTNPTVHSKGAFLYGARAIGGYRILSLEAEATRATSREDFATPVETIEGTTDRFRAGLRSSYDIGSMFETHLRGGVEGSRLKEVTTLNGIRSTQTTPTYANPYVGTGFTVHLSNNLALEAGIVATIPDTKNMRKNIYQTTFGVAVRF